MIEIPYNLLSKTYANTIEIEDIGNCSLKLISQYGCEYTFITKTALGKTQIFKYGPIISDIELFPAEVECSFRRIDFNVFALKKELLKLRDNGKKVDHPINGCFTGDTKIIVNNQSITIEAIIR